MSSRGPSGDPGPIRPGATRRGDVRRRRALRRHGGGYVQRALAFLAGMAVVLVGGWLVLGGPAGGGSAADAELTRGADTESSAPEREEPGRGRGPRTTAASTAAPADSLSFDAADQLDVGFGKTEPRAGLVFDLDSGEVLWTHRPHATRPVASLTKIMSALLVVNETEPQQTVRITRDMIDFNGSAVGLPRGKRVSVRSLMNAMLVQSGNDAALALAIASDGSVSRFVREMNAKARVLGLRCTRFVSPHGLEPGNRSCAADLAVLARLAMRRPLIAGIVRQDGAVVRWPIKGGKLHLAPTNPLLISGYPGTIGLKTGYTEAAGRNIVAVVRREGRTLVTVLLDSPSPGQQSVKLFDAAFGVERRGQRRHR
jgi:serine-type D-Ala-D-Ala carboxypeptidase (penicillin-binding protein 5/6)